MAKVKEIQIEVTYKVGFGNIDMPKKVKEQLIEAYNNGDRLIMEGSPKYIEACEWLTQNIQERDCFRWEAEIEQID